MCHKEVFLEFANQTLVNSSQMPPNATASGRVSRAKAHWKWAPQYRRIPPRIWCNTPPCYTRAFVPRRRVRGKSKPCDGDPGVFVLPNG